MSGSAQRTTFFFFFFEWLVYIILYAFTCVTLYKLLFLSLIQIYLFLQETMVSAVFNDQDWQVNQEYATYTEALQKPDNDEREYRLIKLANQLEVLLICDPETDRASAALDVHVGSFSDPVKFKSTLLSWRK